MTAQRPVLSICIPTYNRATLLNRCLEHLLNDLILPFPFEVVVCDNASSDNTTEVVSDYIARGLNINYIRQNKNIGAYENHCAAIRNGSGQLMLYLADDDYLIVDPLINAVNAMLAQPDIVAVYTPYESYDELTETNVGNSYKNSSDLVVSKENFLPFFEFLIINGYRPEIGLYRADVVAVMMVPRVFNTLSYTNLVHLLQKGKIVILGAPFYRFIVRGVLNPHQWHEGINMARNLWNQERGGLEEFFVVMAHMLGVPISEEGKSALSSMLDLAEVSRIVSAMGLCFNAKDYLQAYELFIRARLTMTRRDISIEKFPQMSSIGNLLFGRLEIDVIIHILKCMTTVKRIVLFRASDADLWMSLFAERDLPGDIEIISTSDAEDLLKLSISTSLFIVQSAEHENALLAAGIKAGLVLNAASLLERYRIFPSMLLD